MHPVFESVRAGELDKALSLAEGGVRENPSCALARSVLADILMIRGEYERAETHLGAVLRFDPSQQREIESLMQLLRAECDRQQVFAEGRSPEFLVPPDEAARLRLGAIAHRRAGMTAEADRMLLDAARCEREFSAQVGSDEAAPFADWDSRFGATIEALTTSGRYYWIPLALVRSIDFAPVRTLRDLAWRSAVVTLGDGAAGVEEGAAKQLDGGFGGGLGMGGNVAFVFMPTRYPGSESHQDGSLRAGIATEWSEPAEGVGIGVGQRTFLCGDATHAAVSIASLRAVPPAAKEAGGV